MKEPRAGLEPATPGFEGRSSIRGASEPVPLRVAYENPNTGSACELTITVVDSVHLLQMRFLGFGNDGDVVIPLLEANAVAKRITALCEATDWGRDLRAAPVEHAPDRIAKQSNRPREFSKRVPEHVRHLLGVLPRLEHLVDLSSDARGALRSVNGLLEPHDSPSVETRAGVPAPAAEVEDTVGAPSDAATGTPTAAASEVGTPRDAGHHALDDEHEPPC